MPFERAKSRNLKHFALALVLTILGGPVCADQFPLRPITMIVPFVPGGPSDLVGRFAAMGMGPVLGQNVVVENVTGGGGMAGGVRVANSPPDGYVIGLGTVGTLAQSQSLYKKPMYNPVTDFTPVALLANVPLVLVVRKDMPVSNLKEFIAYVRERQEQMQYGSAGSAGQLGCVLVNYVIGLKVLHVPYRGSAPALQDLQAGRLDYMCDIMTTAKGPIDSGVVKPIAVLDSKRSPALPNVPTAEEQGTADLIAYTWNALFLPKNAPESVVTTLYAASRVAMRSQAVKERLVPLGAEIAADDKSGPQYLGELIKSEIAKWAIPIRGAGVTVE